MNLEILKLKYPEIDFSITGNVIVQDDGDGPYIAKWDLPYPMPSQEEIIKLEKEFNREYELKLNRDTNKKIYDQLKELDLKSIRALRENNVERIQAIEEQAKVLRAQLLPVNDI